MKSGGTRVRTDYTAGCSPLISLTLEHPECIMGIKKHTGSKKAWLEKLELAIHHTDKEVKIYAV